MIPTLRRPLRLMLGIESNAQSRLKKHGKGTLFEGDARIANQNDFRGKYSGRSSVLVVLLRLIEIKANGTMHMRPGKSNAHAEHGRRDIIYGLPMRPQSP